MKAKRTGTPLKAVSLILGLSCVFLHAEKQHTVKIAPKDGDNFIVASFNYLAPEKNTKPRYILVLTPGFNGDGKRFLQQQQWRDFARTTGGAIVACTYIAMHEQTPDEIKNYVHYAAAQHGSGAALESAIEQFDALDPAHSLKDLPLLIYGHSAGGQFAYGFTCHNPKRMIGFAAAKGGYYYPEPIEGTYQVPGLLISGEQDLARRKIEIRTLFESHRKHGAPWCWMEDAYGHGTADTLEVVIPYFRELLQMRLSADNNGLKAIAKDAGVIVDLRTKTIRKDVTATNGGNTDPFTAFLPSMKIFERWAQHDTGKNKYLSPVNQADKK